MHQQEVHKVCFFFEKEKKRMVDTNKTLTFISHVAAGLQIECRAIASGIVVAAEASLMLLLGYSGATRWSSSCIFGTNIIGWLKACS